MSNVSPASVPTTVLPASWTGLCARVGAAVAALNAQLISEGYSDMCCDDHYLVVEDTWSPAAPDGVLEDAYMVAELWVQCAAVVHPLPDPQLGWTAATLLFAPDFDDPQAGDARRWLAGVPDLAADVLDDLLVHALFPPDSDGENCSDWWVSTTDPDLPGVRMLSNADEGIWLRPVARTEFISALATAAATTND